MKCRWGQVEDISPSKASPSYGIKRTKTQTWCTWCWLPQSRPTPVKRHDRFMLGIWLSQMRRLQTYTEKYDGAGRLSGLPLLQTHCGVKVEAWPQRSSPCFCAKVSKERFAKVSSNTPRPHTPWIFKFTLRSLTQVTVLHFVLRLSYYQTHDFFKNVFSLSSGNGFSVLLSFLHTKSYKTPLFRGGKWKTFPGAQPPDPLPSSDTTQTPPPATPL